MQSSGEERRVGARTLPYSAALSQPWCLLAQPITPSEYDHPGAYGQGQSDNRLPYLHGHPCTDLPIALFQCPAYTDNGRSASADRLPGVHDAETNSVMETKHTACVAGCWL